MRKKFRILAAGISFLLIMTAGCGKTSDPEPAAAPAVSPAVPSATPEEVVTIPRDRVQLAYGTVVTDRMTLLRGAYWPVDFAGQLPKREALERIRDIGLNSLHLYGEKYGDGVPAGGYIDQIDTIVQWCGELGLYCVLTIGNGMEGGGFDYEFAADFWNIYAPRYKDKTWVVYEIYNEPEFWAPPYSDDTIRLQQDMYDLIRSLAPDTHILLFSYSSLSTADAVLQDIQRLDIDWSNASVAWHAYTDLATEEACLQGMRAAGINTINSELAVGQCCEPGWADEPWWADPLVNTDKIRMAEENFTSWLTHIDLDYIHDDWRFRDRIIESGIFWEPDYGTFPGKGSSD